MSNILSKVVQGALAQNRLDFITKNHLAGVMSFHEGEYQGFMWTGCDCCGDVCGGDKWELVGLKPKAVGGMEPESLGNVCATCIEYFEG